MKSGFSLPSSRKRFSENRPLPRPVRLMVLRYCLGMMASVSTLIDLRGAATPSRTVNFSIPHLQCHLTAPHAAGRRRERSTANHRFSPEKSRKPLVSAAVVMNAESGSVKAVRVGGPGPARLRSPKQFASGRLTPKTRAGRVGAVDGLDRALDRRPQPGDLDPAGRVAIKLARARAGGKRAQESPPLADLARPNWDGQSIKFRAGQRHRGRFLLLAFDGRGVDHHRVRLVALARGLDR